MDVQDNTVFRQRLAQVRQQLDAWQVDGLLVSSPHNRRWLSGFTGSAGTLLITAEQARLATDFRYWEQAAQQAPAYELFKLTNSQEGINGLLAQAGANRFGIEARHVTLAQLERWQRADGVVFVSLESSVEPWRELKNEAELATMRRAAAITDMAMEQVPQLAHAGMTERALAWQLEKLMREAGAEGMAFEIIVAAGPNGALAHHHPGDRPLALGDAIVVDMGARVDGYNSDLTRTFHLGSQPDERFWEVFHLVEQAQEAALAGIRAGITGQEADGLARQVIVAAGHGEHFGHSLGHGVGLEVHEGPSLSPIRGEKPLHAGMVTSVEPGVYLPGWGGVRLEDLVLVTEEGLNPLSHSHKDPIIPA